MQAPGSIDVAPPRKAIAPAGFSTVPAFINASARQSPSSIQKLPVLHAAPWIMGNPVSKFLRLAAFSLAKGRLSNAVEFPGLSWLAESPDSALKGIREVVEDVINDMKESGESPPDPLSCRKFSGKFVVRIPPNVHRRLAIQAAEEGISLNRLVSAKLSR